MKRRILYVGTLIDLAMMYESDVEDEQEENEVLNLNINIGI